MMETSTKPSLTARHTSITTQRFMNLFVWVMLGLGGLGACGDEEQPEQDQDAGSSLDAGNDTDAASDADDASTPPNFCDESTRDALITQGVFPNQGDLCDCEGVRFFVDVCPCENNVRCLTSSSWVCGGVESRWGFNYTCDGPHDAGP